MSTADIEVAYDGPALANHTMNVLDLAPALLSIGKLFEESNRLLNGDKAKVVVEIKADFERACFGIHLVVLVDFIEQIKNALLSPGMMVANALVSVTGFNGLVAANSLLGLLRKLKEKHPEEVIHLSNGNVAIKYTEDGEKKEVLATEEALRLCQSPEVRRAVEAIVAPLKQEGIDRFQVREKGRVVYEITQEDLTSFAEPDIKQLPPLIDNTAEILVTILQPALDGDYIWRVSEGEKTVYQAKMEDAAFKSDVQSARIAFRKGDVLKVLLNTRQWRGADGKITSERRILQVLEHIPTGIFVRQELTDADTKDPETV